MLGAILGDIIGSPYENPKFNIKTTMFPLFSKESTFTDDTIMTLAVGHGLIKSYGKTDNETEQEVIKSMRKIGNKYIHGGYGSNFLFWIQDEDMGAYNSYGNGSAMRVSSVAWLYNDLSQVEKYAKLTAQVTHNHPEGIKGAQATASAIFLARNKAKKEYIKKYIITKYGYDLNRKLDDIRPIYHFKESCQETVPEAIIAFLESDSFEHAIRLAVSLGGDSDTLGAITGSIAEAYYGISNDLKKEAISRLDKYLRIIYYEIDDFINRLEK